jgi:hypothetical protein
MLNKALDHGIYWTKGGVQALKQILCELRGHVSALRPTFHLVWALILVKPMAKGFTLHNSTVNLLRSKNF